MRSQISAYPTRNCQDIDIPKRNLEFSKKSFLYAGAKLWNDIPLDMRNSPQFSHSKKTEGLLATLAFNPKHDP